MLILHLSATSRVLIHISYRGGGFITVGQSISNCSYIYDFCIPDRLVPGLLKLDFFMCK